MTIGYVTTPPVPGTWIRAGSIHLQADRHGEAGEFTVSNQMRSWHLAIDRKADPDPRDKWRLLDVAYTRCGRGINYDAHLDAGRSGHVQFVVAVTDDPGDAACARCERRPGIDRRLLEDGLFAARIVVKLLPEDERPTDAQLRQALALQFLRRKL